MTPRDAGRSSAAVRTLANKIKWLRKNFREPAPLHESSGEPLEVSHWIQTQEGESGQAAIGFARPTRALEGATILLLGPGLLVCAGVRSPDRLPVLFRL